MCSLGSRSHTAGVEKGLSSVPVPHSCTPCTELPRASLTLPDDTMPGAPECLSTASAPGDSGCSLSLTQKCALLVRGASDTAALGLDGRAGRWAILPEACPQETSLAGSSAGEEMPSGC